ncbi:MAG: putative RND superfamily exporter protein [Patiriisocius sp.]
MKKIDDKWFRKYARLTLIGLLLATVFFIYQASKVGFDYDFEKFYPTSDSETEFFFEFRDKFQSDNDFLLISIENKTGVFDLKFLKKVDRFTQEISKLKYIDSVSSITNQKEYFIGLVTTNKQLIDFKNVDLKRDSIRIYSKPELINSFIAKDGKSVCIFVKHQDFLARKYSGGLLDKMEAMSDKYGFNKTRIVGRIIGQKYYIKKMMGEMVFFVALSAILIVIFLFIAFRSVWGILIPQFVILGGMIWLIGTMSLFDQPINIILTVLPSVMFVVSMSDTIHLVSRYLDALRTEESTLDAIKMAVREVGMATLLTSITTSIGFFSLVFVRVEPIQVFGVVMGIGVLIAFILTFVTLPALFYFFPGPKYVRKKKQDHFWRKRLEKWFIIVLKRKRLILGISAAIVAISVYGLLQIKTNNLLMDDLDKSDPLKQDFNYLDAHYGGVRPVELAVTIKSGSIDVWDKDVLQTLDTVQTYLIDKYGLSVKSSLVSGIKIVHRSMFSGLPEYYTLPTQKTKWRDIKRIITAPRVEHVYRMLVDSTRQTTRISGTIPDLGNSTVTKMDKDLRKFLESKTMNGVIDYEVTGTAHLIDKNLSYLSTSLVKGLLVSILIVALLMGLIYRSVGMLLISLIPNLIPLVVIAGVMGFVGVELKISTAIIFTIAFGIAVDDTIHFLGKFKFELMKGRTKVYALKRSYMTTGKAMILTTFILCSGFALLGFSSFLGTFYLGILICIALFVALIADLTLLPVLILLFYKPKKKRG